MSISHCEYATVFVSRLPMFGKSFSAVDDAARHAKARRIMRRHRPYVSGIIDPQLLSAIEDFILEVEQAPRDWFESAGVDNSPESKQWVLDQLQSIHLRWVKEYSDESESRNSLDSSGSESCSDLSASDPELPPPHDKMQIDFLLSK